VPLALEPRGAGFDSQVPDVDIVISDFDNTLFKRNYGVLERSVATVAALGCPVVIVSYRATDQQTFIQETLDGTQLTVIGLVLLGDRSKNPQRKFEAALYLKERYNILAAFDDGEAERAWYDSLGIPVVDLGYGEGGNPPALGAG
jgi:hypothetical protein